MAFIIDKLLRPTTGDTPEVHLRKILQCLTGADGTTSLIQSAGGSPVVVSASFARSADTTAYIVGDVVGPASAAVLTFASAARSAGGKGYVSSVRLSKGAVTTNAAFRLWLYSVAPTAIADNAPFTLLAANADNRIGFVDLACASGGSGSDAADALTLNVNLPFVCASGSAALFGVLEAKQAYTPANAEVFSVYLTVEQS